MLTNKQASKPYAAQSVMAREAKGNTTLPARVLVCQKLSCRQRGSQQVMAAIAHVINTHNQSDTIKIQPTGCMRQCQAGPHIVFIPPKQPAQKAANSATSSKYTCVTPQLAAQILENQISENSL